MRALLCAINSKYVHSSLAVWYLFSSLKKCDGVECEVIEATINEKLDTIYERIIERKADLVAFSTYIWNRQTVLSLAEKIKAETNSKILLGGPEVSYNAEQMLKTYSYLDYIISGEGEEPICRLCQGDPLEAIEGLSYKTADHVAVKSPYISFSDPPNPYTKEYLESLNGRIAYLETSRGCPFHCAFCLSGRCGGVRFFDFERAKENILLLANSGTKTVKFIDRTFNADKKRARELFGFIIDEYMKNIPQGVCFHFEIEGELLDEETFKILETAPKGLFQFEIGLQSFNQETLLSINRRSNLDLLCKNIKRLVSIGNIHIHIDLIIGLPHENLESFSKSFDSAYSLKPHMLQIGFLKLLHGADMREKPDMYKCDFSDTPPYEITSNAWLSSTELRKLHLLEDVFEKMYNSGRFGLTCEYLNGIFKSPFEMFFQFSRFVENEKRPNTLDDFTKMIFEYFGNQKGVSKDRLRDMLAIDRLATNRMGSLPLFLRVKSAKIKESLNLLEKCESTKRPKNVKRAATVLLTESKLAYVDYTECDYVTNRFLVKFTEI